MSLTIFQVDAFTTKPFAGNPAGVCVLSRPAEESWMQNVAREMNLSETAFLFREGDGFRLRWFTPAVEVDLCGHATLGSAQILFEKGYLDSQQTARFSTRSGWLCARQSNGWIELDFPAKPVSRPDHPAGIDEILGVKPVYIGLSQFDLLIEVSTPEEVYSASPDFGKLKEVPVRGVIITSRSEKPEFDFISRFFAPAVGVNEDPVTGSAHCVLTPYWSAKLGRTDLTAFQASQRGGILKLAMRKDRVLISGQAVTVIAGDIQVGPTSLA